MTVCVVYVGDLADPTFKWEGGDWNGNVPARLSPEFPPMSGHYNAALQAWVKPKGVACETTDFGGWVARVTKAHIFEFLAEAYRGNEELPWVADRLPALKRFVGTLLEDHEYGLVATEW
jgi:hypothetical protein